MVIGSELQLNLTETCAEENRMYGLIREYSRL
jgi:hypothetical protein